MKALVAVLLILIAILLFIEKYKKTTLAVRAITLFAGAIIFFIDANK